MSRNVLRTETKHQLVLMSVMEVVAHEKEIFPIYTMDYSGTNCFRNSDLEVHRLNIAQLYLDPFLSFAQHCHVL